MFALVDATSFYASCEKIFEPRLRDKPVIVLSNNDGCVVAACPIAKRLGAPKFEPYFKVKAWAKQQGIVARSSNYELYADMSRRFMQSVAQFAPIQHIYSIDESFIDLHQCNIKDWLQYGWEIRRTVWRETRVPVCVGVAPTLTLAKAANHCGKKLPGHRGVFVINTPEQRKYALSNMMVNDIWGIGRKLTAHLNVLGIHTAYQLSKQPPKRMRKEFNINVEKTVRELRGEPCISWDEVRAAKKEIFSTRSVGKRITTLTELKQALALHAEIVAERARKQQTAIKELLAFATSSPHDSVGRYSRALLYQFTSPTIDSRNVSKAATSLANELYQSGIRFYKVGVGAVRLTSYTPYQPDLFAENTDDPVLMNCLDEINQRWGADTLQFAGKGIKRSFAMKRQLLSPRYTTRWSDLPKLQC